ncbi:hypothetical protein R1flu_028200 [Riccia fluitans]|uniref:Uncharacterized protein n=1 Tax=Riccia fluitans TaxID=41844 RepID=A0ABD1XL15_9MARC
MPRRRGLWTARIGADSRMGGNEVLYSGWSSRTEIPDAHGSRPLAGTHYLLLPCSCSCSQLKALSQGLADLSYSTQCSPSAANVSPAASAIHVQFRVPSRPLDPPRWTALRMPWPDPFHVRCPTWPANSSFRPTRVVSGFA